MNSINLINILGGLSLFLYGMQMMSNGLETVAGTRMKTILEKLTTNRLAGVLTGLVITAIIQSSSATTVMVVGFVNAGMMTLNQAVWLIMGANIGTTITGQLIALDAGKIAPLFAFAGVSLVMFSKSDKKQQLGKILAGLGILFIGMNLMSDALSPLKDSPLFQSALTQFSNPLIGILAGAVFTALIQSSSASVGVLQILAGSGMLPFSQAVFVLFGQNIGTCITALLASIGVSKNAKRTTVIHFSFNIIGTLVFTMLCLLTPLSAWVAFITPGSIAAQIANMHTLFNVVTTLLLLPFGNLFPVLARKLLPDTPESGNGQKASGYTACSPVSGHLGSSAMILTQTHRQISDMFELAKNNVSLAFEDFSACDSLHMEEILAGEEEIDSANHKISQTITHALMSEMSVEESCDFNAYAIIASNLERIGDHALNLSEYAVRLHKKEVHLSKEVQAEIQTMENTLMDMMQYFYTFPLNDEVLSNVTSLEQTIDAMEKHNRKQMMKRQRKGICTPNAVILYSEMLTDFERMGDCTMNILEELSKVRRYSE